MNKYRGQGLIPAGAGLTGGSTGRWDDGSAHPRRCGAHSRRPVAMTLAPGSSPQVRGSRLLCATSHTFSRLIPAGAGLTSWR